MNRIKLRLPAAPVRCLHPVELPELNDIRKAAVRIAGEVHSTPVLSSATLNAETGAELFFKCENFQRTGSFKFRGATNAVLSLSEIDYTNGVCTHSSGNHGAALAAAAAGRGIAAQIVVPENAAQPKQDSIRRYGGVITHCEPTLEARETMLAEVQKRTGATFVSPYNDFRIISGQGTAALELMEEVDGLDCLIAPVGGGGLLSGTAVVGVGLRVFGAEPEQADDAKRSLDAGEIMPSHPDTIADGLLTSLGTMTFAVISEHVEDILTVSETEIIEAMRTSWQLLKIVIEPSSAVVVAAVLRNHELFAGKRVGVILTGGNVDLARLPF